MSEELKNMLNVCMEQDKPGSVCTILFFEIIKKHGICKDYKNDMLNFLKHDLYVSNELYTWFFQRISKKNNKQIGEIIEGFIRLVPILEEIRNKSK